MQYLGLPAFWYFISSFTFESRLFILVWRAQLDQRQMFDDAYLRRSLTWFYISFYVCAFAAVIFQGIVLYQTWSILLLNASVWIPQIIHTYIKRTKKGPSIQFAAALLAMQLFMPLYLMMDDKNFLDNKTNVTAGFCIIVYVALQLLIMKRQQTHGPRWFVPKAIRRNPFAHNYYRQVPASVIRRAKKQKDPTLPSRHEDDL